MRRIPPGATVLLLLALAVAASAAEPAKPTLALVGGRIIDGYEGRPIEGLFLSEYTADSFPERLNDPRWQEGIAPDLVRDIRESLRNIGGLPYFQLVRRRIP